MFQSKCWHWLGWNACRLSCLSVSRRGCPFIDRHLIWCESVGFVRLATCPRELSHCLRPSVCFEMIECVDKMKSFVPLSKFWRDSLKWRSGKCWCVVRRLSCSMVGNELNEDAPCDIETLSGWRLARPMGSLQRVLFSAFEPSKRKRSSSSQRSSSHSDNTLLTIRQYFYDEFKRQNEMKDSLIWRELFPLRLFGIDENFFSSNVFQLKICRDLLSKIPMFMSAFHLVEKEELLDSFHHETRDKSCREKIPQWTVILS